MGIRLLLIAVVSQMTIGVRVLKKRSPASLTRSKPICDASTVAATCKAFTAGASEVAVTSKDIADSFSVAEERVVAFLHKLDLTAQSLTCQNLCQKTMASFPADRLPPAAFVGCHTEGLKKVCDVDLSVEGLAELAHRHTPDGPLRDKKQKADRAKRPTKIGSLEASSDSMPPLQATFGDVQKEVAQWFGVWTVLGQQAVSLESKDDLGLVCGTMEDWVDYKGVLHGNTRGCSSIGGASNQAELDRIVVDYLVNTKQRLRSGCTNLLQVWFGDHKSAFSDQAYSRLSYAQHILNNAYYVNWKEAGRDPYWNWESYGMVWSGEMIGGKYVIHLGQPYFDEGQGQRVNTLVHEAFHHPPMNTDDNQYCHQDQCTDLKSYAVRNPGRAKNNAASWAFFVDDVMGSDTIIGGSCSR